MTVKYILLFLSLSYMMQARSLLTVEIDPQCTNYYKGILQKKPFKAGDKYFGDNSEDQFQDFALVLSNQFWCPWICLFSKKKGEYRIIKKATTTIYDYFEKAKIQQEICISESIFDTVRIDLLKDESQTIDRSVNGK